MNKFYFKLIAIIIITALLITFSTLVYIRVKIANEKSQLLRPGYREFLFYLVKEIEENPTKEKIKEIAKNNDLIIRVIDKNKIILSNNAFFSSEKFLTLTKKRQKRFKVFHNPRRLAPREITFYFDNKVLAGLEFSIFKKKFLFIKLPDKTTQNTANFVIAFIILFFLLVAGLLIKKSFVDPLRQLEFAIKNFSNNIHDSKNIEGHGELKNLFHTFSNMKIEVTKHIEERERLLRDISHDLRSPLTRMKVALELMDNSKIKEKLQTDVNELSFLVNQILESRTINNFPKETIQIKQFINNYIETHSFPIQVCYKKQNNFYISGNKKQLTRVLNNLIDNSNKYSDGKEVEIETYQIENKGIVKISDSGFGIDEDILKKIFLPFFKQDNSRRQDIKTGSGLGLTITKQIINTMNGEIKAYPSPKNGLTIEIQFEINNKKKIREP
jgi:signal transduction histidine kinase